MSQEVRDLRRLVIKAFHIENIEAGSENEVSPDGKMKVHAGIERTDDEKAAIDRNFGDQTGRT